MLRPGIPGNVSFFPWATRDSLGLDRRGTPPGPGFAVAPPARPDLQPREDVYQLSSETLAWAPDPHTTVILQWLCHRSFIHLICFPAKQWSLT